MKFAHFADCHIGSWRDPLLQDASTEAFEKAIDDIILKKVDFLLITGDLFNTALPSIDKLKRVVKKLKTLKNNDIQVYIIAGSHDYSPSGKTMLDVLEEAELFVNVARGNMIDDKLELNFTTNKKTGAKIVGMPGKKGSLEKTFYQQLNRTPLEKEEGFKIFMFHSAIDELKSEALKQIDSTPLSLLPKNFDYYAGGHVHERIQQDNIVYPGPLFANNFKELEELKHGTYVLYDDGEISFEPIIIHNVQSVELDCTGLIAEQVIEKLKEQLANKEYYNTIITIRLSGQLVEGKLKDINLQDFTKELYNNGAYFVMRNTSALKSKEFSELKADFSSIQDIEQNILAEHLDQLPKKFNNLQLLKDLLQALSEPKLEGERVTDFEKRIIQKTQSLLEKT
ncbi:DNA repair exonuclease [Candidatus Woesearchaeota archaeon]|nr:DNA repair exonuclease [Candidatus Woesearchaeota archaeon]